jgi:dienelactone hydrolase
MPRRTRRQVLGALGLGLSAALGGCSALQNGDATTTVTGTPSPAGTTTPATTPADRTSTATTSTQTTRDSDGPGTPTEVTLEARTREFLALLGEGEFEAAHEELAPVATEDLPATRLERVWTGVEQQDGPYRTVTDFAHSTRNGYQLVVATALFETGRRDVRVFFDEAGDVAGFFVGSGATYDWSPPAYGQEDALTERELSLTATDDCSLGATLTLPTGSDTVPGVVLVHGSGPQDRDETVGPNKPFKDIAWGLASRGIAVLRYDKRTQACDVDPSALTIDDVVTNDALRAIARLRGHERVIEDGVVVVGHSLGATMVPRIAEREGALAGAAMLAPLGRSLADAIVDQSRYLFELDGDLTGTEADRLDEIRATAEQIRTLDIAEGEVVLSAGREYWRTLSAYDRFATARRIETPLFLAFGGRDWQVTVEDDRPLWRDALADREATRFETYPAVNHYFMAGEGQPTRAEYFEEGHVERSIVEDLAAWTSRVIDR